MPESIPTWANEVIESGDSVIVQNGILRCQVVEGDGGIEYYRSLGGAHMHERSAVSYAMSALDTGAYRDFLSDIRPKSLDALIVDVGGGDGRNAMHWLEWGYKRIVVIDPIVSGLDRFRARVAAHRPDWLSNLLLVEADARRIPLVSNCAARVQAIEALYYLNEDYEQGLRECMRVLSGPGRLFVSERDYEGGLLTSLLYGGLGEWLAQAKTRDVWDGVADLRVRSRCFTERELSALLTRNGLSILSHRGMSAFSLILGYLSAKESLLPADEAHLADAHRLLSELGRNGSMRRCHVVVAKKDA